jgi:CMP-N-acetylneuraminic acid synthetase
MIEKRNIIGDNFYKFVTSQEESIDIDTMLDFKIAEFLYNNREE